MAQSALNPMDIVQDLIRPTEEAKVAIDARSAPRTDADSETWSGAGDAPAVLRRKILAVVAHLHPNGRHEQGCVFVLSEKPRRIDSIPGEYVVEHAFPVVDSLSISMSQPRRTTVDLSSPPPGGAFTASQARPELTVTIEPGQDTPFPPVTLQTTDIHGLRKILLECRHLKEVLAAETEEDEYDFEPFAWIGPYIAGNVIPPLLNPFPPDLRRIQKALHAHLSAASAGVPGNDVADIEAIREEWMRRKVEEDVSARHENAVLRIRVGTFNVNGKLPSQDLSAWVRRQMGRPGSSLIPPLKAISPLSLGEVQKDPIETKMEALDINGVSDSPGAVAPSDGPSSATSATGSSVTLSVDTESQVASVSEAPSDVTEDPTDPDVLVLGFQELDLSTEALLYSTKTVREDAWCMAIFAGLGEKAILYEKLVSKQLVGMLLVIITKKRHHSSFSEIRTSSAGAGIMGIMGNKGATAVRLLFTPIPTSPSAGANYEGKPVVLTFVNAHLAAFDEMFEKRNADFHDLSKRLQFDSGLVADDSAAPGGAYGPPTVQLSIFETDALFWLVNLNYRITIPDADVRNLLASELLREENIATLRQYDQLTLAMRRGKAFEGFVELLISHLPSYRFGAGLLADSLGYDTKRKPAWTDRILHMASSAVAVKQTSYNSHPTITMSDHRPVSAEFELEVPVVSIPEYETYVERIWRDVSSAEYAEERPRVRVGPTSIDFSKVYYKRSVKRTLVIENIGKVPCSYRLVPQAPTAEPCPEWLRIDAMTGLVRPGEKAEISLTVYVGDSTASRLNVGSTRLEETLVIHTALGRDHFVAIGGEYERTCFATSMTWLVRLPGPVRELKSPRDLLPEDRGVNAPREIMRLVNWLMSDAMQTDGLFLTRGDKQLVERIRESLDTGAEFAVDGPGSDPKAALAYADALLELLGSLIEPVIPTSLHAKCAQMTSRDEAFEILDELPVVNVNVWISLTAFLHYVGQQDSSQDHTERLVAIFTPVLFRDDLSSPMPVSAVGKRNFLRYFIG
ncbi:DNase I-like protein [Lenzites betulinus]|nr:DNase I-like protein [Lenzites betulinus]